VTARYLLDTNIISDLVRHPQGMIAARILRVGQDRISTSIIVAAELRYGAARGASARFIAQVESILSAIAIIPFEAPADVTYGTLRATLERHGQLIGGNDLLIAAQAMTLGSTLVTDNEREFARIENLRVENWLRR
jgi:tRNA(fMet)-specific endonuclease VapC